MDRVPIQSLCCWCHTPLHKIEYKNAFVWACPTPACFQRQAAYAIIVERISGRKAREECLYLPLPKQVEGHEAVDRGIKYILYGGAAAGSKSHFLRHLAYQTCLMIPGFHVLLLRRKYPELESTHIRAAELEVPKFGERCYPSRFCVPFEGTGSLLRFGHCQERTDFLNHLSTEYDLILFDELVTFEEEMFLMISTRARSTKKRRDGTLWQPVVVSATNPGGPFSSWIVQRWIEKNVDRSKYSGYDPNQYLYIPATLDDNPYINQADYDQTLRQLPAELAAAYREGRWDIFPGQYFKEWRASKHIQDFGILPPFITRYRAIDWGRFKPGVVGWFAALPDGHLYMEHELKFGDQNPTQVAQEVLRRQAQWYSPETTIHSTAADPAMWIRQSESGESIAETFARAGVPLMASNHERVNGWNRLHEWLADAPDGKPWLMFHPSCVYTTRTMPAQVQDAIRLEDVDTKGEDHAADMLRYLVMMRPSPTIQEQPKSFPPGSAGEMMQQLIHQSAQPPILGSEQVVPYHGR